MALLPVTDARARLLAAVDGPTAMERVAIGEAHGRVLAEDVAALRTQPPFAGSAMDGYAVRAADLAPGVTLAVIGASQAGRSFAGRVEARQAVRIFTGAPLPEGADTILIQENAEGVGGPVITARQSEPRGRFVRPAGLDFKAGDRLLTAGMRLDARRLALAAGMGHAALSVRRRPLVGILATGDELVLPGAPCGPDQIIASNGYALAALIRDAGGEPLDLGIAADTLPALHAAFDQAEAAGVDALVTLGGASVGDHDLVQKALVERGMALDFWKIAMRPGKPLMFGRLGQQLVVGLPGNPVSSMVCGTLFVQPLLRALLGEPDVGPRRMRVRLGRALGANDEREDYLRGTLAPGADGIPVATPFERQDSAMMALLAAADALVIRPAQAPAAASGELAEAIPLAPLAV